MSTIDDDDIRQLRDEAGAAGDLEQVRICERALDGDGQAWEECARVITDAAARAAEDGDGEPATEMVRVIDLYVRCSYPLRPDAIAASDTCQHPANTAVRDKNGNLWWRCPTHEGELTNGVYGVEVVTEVPRDKNEENTR